MLENLFITAGVEKIGDEVARVLANCDGMTNAILMGILGGNKDKLLGRELSFFLNDNIQIRENSLQFSVIGSLLLHRLQFSAGNIARLLSSLQDAPTGNAAGVEVRQLSQDGKAFVSILLQSDKRIAKMAAKSAIRYGHDFVRFIVLSSNEFRQQQLERWIDSFVEALHGENDARAKQIIKAA